MRTRTIQLQFINVLLCIAARRTACHLFGPEQGLLDEVEDFARQKNTIDIVANTSASRRLHKHHKHNRESVQEQVAPPDYSEYSCDEINEMESRHQNDNGDFPQQQQQQQHGGSPRFDRCLFAKTCNGGDGIMFPSLFCSETTDYSGETTSTTGRESRGSNNKFSLYNSLSRALLIIGLSLVLLMLFRLLNSTTDEFFSPGLELFSLHLGLPPRFAGVTLLALGNGAPDVAATMNAMLQDEKNGYLLAIGELTGTTMFVSAVILGFIVRLGGSQTKNHGEDAKDNGGNNTIIGVPCKGPFLRDIAVLCLVTVISMSYFHQGIIDYTFVHAMLGIYVVYVMVVLGADAYHIFYHVPRLAREDNLGDNTDTAKDDDNEHSITVEYGKWKQQKTHSKNDIEDAKCHEPIKLDTTNTEVVGECTPLIVQYSSRSDGSRTRKHHHTLKDTVIEAMSNYSCNEQEDTHDNNSGGCQKEMVDAELAHMRSLSSNANNSPSSKPTGWGPKSADGTEAIVTFHPHHAIHPHHDKNQVVFRRASGSNAGVVRTMSRGESWESTGDPNGNGAAVDANTKDDKSAVFIEQRSGIELVPKRPSSWKEAWHSNAREWNEHWIDFFRDIYQNPENSKVEVILLSIELPFTILRKLTNPVPCDGYYCRPIVAVSFALSPIWVYFYFNDQFSVDIFSSSAGFILVAVTTASAILILRYSPDSEGPMDFISVIPMTLYGFAIAATWLDSIADKLVELLEFFGIVLRIPNSVMGLTVLAFGNSIQDLVANVSLSKKGLNTMALTACLAGPIFNMCVGLGGGFWVLMKSTGRDEIHVKFPSNIKTGFYFTIANCALVVLAGTVFGRGVIGREYGYVACGLYAVYVLTSLVV